MLPLGSGVTARRSNRVSRARSCSLCQRPNSAKHESLGATQVSGSYDAHCASEASISERPQIKPAASMTHRGGIRRKPVWKGMLKAVVKAALNHDNGKMTQ